ncbi:hypothetical protein N0V88_005542 [Collariella sp. IMI 366227]|nr:hypothetical protein N0V88_005542 [Collariella sp. IMI 366227]
MAGLVVGISLRSWARLVAPGLGLFSLLLGVSILPSTVSAKALVAADGQTGDPDYTCSADKPCALGCCNHNGICGMGPDFCSAENCVNSCDAKSECDPSNWGPQYAANEKCPLNVRFVCCSKYGFCGTTPEFCGDTQVASPSCPGGKSANKRTIGYYEGWGVGRACDAMLPEQIPVAAYTHINFAFAMIDPVSFAIAPMSDGDVDLYPRLTGLKELYPNLKVWISIGGWSMNDPDQPTATTFSDVAGSAANQQKFFASLISFMSQYGFDGVDIDWEYPVAPERSGRPEDFTNYPTFLQNLRNAFQAAGKSWGLTITMPSSFWYLQHFDIAKLEPIVDWFNMMADVLAYIAAHTNLTEIDQSMKLLWRNGINPEKVVLGLGFYGRSYTLQDSSCNTAGCPFTAGGPAGPCTNSVGTLSYGEIQQLIQAGAQPVLDSTAAVQTLTYGGGNNWVSYDDETTLKMKVDYANDHCLGGTMVWAASTDDSNGSAAQALAAASGFVIGPQGTHIGLVVPGTSALTQTLTGDGGDTPCTSGRRSLCCPTSGGSSFIPETCGWYRNAFHDTCTPGCPQDKVQLAVDSAGANCVRGYGSFCCDPPVNTLDGRNSPQVKDFYYLVDDFMNNGRCSSANDASIPKRKKRQSTSAPFIFDSNLMAQKLLNLLWAWARQPTSKPYVTPFHDVWDERVTAYGNKFPKFDIMANAMLSYNPIEGTSVDFLENVLCNGRFGEDSLRDQQAAATYLCTRVAPSLSGRNFDAASSNYTDSGNANQLTKREFFNNFVLGSSEPGLPTAGDAIAAVVAGELRPEYYTFFRYSATEIEMEAVFLLGSNPNSILENMRRLSYHNFLVMHIHFNPTLTSGGRLAVSQINIRHAATIRQVETTNAGAPIPGQYTAGLSETGGTSTFRCLTPDSALDPATTAEGETPRERLTIQLVRMLNGWGANGDLFNQNNPDLTTCLRVERGPRTGNVKKDANTKKPIPMFNGGRFAEGNGHVAFRPNGDLYNPLTSNGGDIVNTEGFYTPAS